MNHTNAAERPAASLPVIEANEVIQRLLDLPGEMAERESELLRFEEDRRQAEVALQAATDTLLLSGLIDGKNAEVREAQVRAGTTTERAALAMEERLVASAKFRLHCLQNEFASYRSVARLLAAFSSD